MIPSIMEKEHHVADLEEIMDGLMTLMHSVLEKKCEQNFEMAKKCFTCKDTRTGEITLHKIPHLKKLAQ